jgi:uncharacterized protein (DUF486 family)
VLKSIISRAEFAKKNTMKATTAILLLVLSNTFMTFAWYGHLRFKEMDWSKNLAGSVVYF